MSNKGLGKGLSSLITAAANESVEDDGVVTELPLDVISPNPDQPRSEFDEQGIEELADSIKKDGILQPILVRPTGDSYQIIAGERRWQACRKLELETVPVRVMVIDETRTLELALIENLQRTDLNAIEEARGYKRIMDVSEMTQAEIANTVSKSRSAVANALRLLDLPDEVQEMMFEGKLSAGHARTVLSIPSEEGRIKLARKIVEDKLSVREAEQLSRLFATEGMERTKRIPTPRSYKLVARKLRQRLNANVRVKTVRGKNKIEIDFKDEEDLERIFSLIESQQDSSQESDALESDTSEQRDFEIYNID